jgi:hypothetical protein
VLGGVLGGSSVGDDLKVVLSCVGHRVMVPPPRGTRGAMGAYVRRTRAWTPPWNGVFVVKVLYKG